MEFIDDDTRELPGRFFPKSSQNGGFDIYYRSYRYKVSLYYCWTNSEERVYELLGELNCNILGNVIKNLNGIEKELEITAKLVSRNSKF